MLLVHTAARDDVDLREIPEVFRPWVEGGKEWYNGVWADVLPFAGGVGKAYEGYGVDRTRGCLVLVRPDGHVMFVNDLESLEDLELLLDEVLVVQR